MFVLALAEDLDGRALKRSSDQTEAPGNTPRAKACPTQDGRRCLQKQRERYGGCRANRFQPKTPAVFIIWSKAIFKKARKI